MSATADTTQGGKQAMGHLASVSQQQGKSATASAAQMAENVRQGDNTIAAVRGSDSQSSLRALAEGTGGFLIANTNDFRKPFQQLASDLDTHYEVVYHPTFNEVRRAAQEDRGEDGAQRSAGGLPPVSSGRSSRAAAPTGTEIGVVELISLGYTTLRAPAGHLIVVPNSLAASQVTINLNASGTFAPWPLIITMHIGRDADLTAARELALKIAGEAKDVKVLGCFLTKVDAASVTLELRLAATDSAHRDKLRSSLLERLSQRFAEAHLGASGAEAATFA